MIPRTRRDRDVDFRARDRVRDRRRLPRAKSRRAKTRISTSSIFDDVVNLITSNYVEKVNIDKVMSGAMHGLADSLDPDSAYLTADQVKQIESERPAAGRRRRHRPHAPVLPARHRGARRLAGREGRPAHRRLRPRHRRHADARDVGLGRHAPRCAARPARRSSLTIIRGNAADPHVVELTREAMPPTDVTGRIAAPGVGYLRIAADRPAHGRPGRRRRSRISSKAAPSKLIVDVRRTSGGSLDGGLALARLFVAAARWRSRETQGAEQETIAADAGDGSVTLPTIAADRHRHVRRAPSSSRRRWSATSAPT